MPCNDTQALGMTLFAEHGAACMPGSAPIDVPQNSVPIFSIDMTHSGDFPCSSYSGVKKNGYDYEIHSKQPRLYPRLNDDKCAFPNP